MDSDPRFIDTAVRRWRDVTGHDAVLAATGQTFDEVSATRAPVKARKRP